MPALHFFKRKWLVACDDLVIPFAIESVVRVVWLLCLGVLLLLKIKDCYENEIINYTLYAIAVELLLTSCLTIALSVVSARGHVMEVEKRSYVSLLLYIKVFTLIVDIGFASFSTWLWVHMSQDCLAKNIFLKCTTIGAWGYLIIVFIAVLVCYDSLGSSKYWNTNVNPNALNFFKKAQYIWKLRLKLFCCCADISEENDLIYVEISTFLASFLNGNDLVPTDILAGIITLSEKHALERRKYTLGVHSVPYSNVLLESHEVPGWMTPENALYFLRIAKSTYGWIAFYDMFHPWNLCILSSNARCCLCSCRESNEGNLDNCCHLNFAAVQKITGFTDQDILFASFQNNIREPAFYVAVDHQRRYVILSIRGTRSFSDLVTDLDAETSEFPIGLNQQRFRCHRGALQSALFLHKKLLELNVLNVAMCENPSYTLAITGHSLGGSVAAVLAMILRPKYPDLQCYAFGPLAMMSVDGMPETLDYIFSVVVGDDLSPRLSASAMRELRRQIITSLVECNLPKYKILLRACWYHVQKYLKMKPDRIVCEVYENKHYENDEENIIQHSEGPNYDKSNVYAPGRILYFERKKWNEPYWVTGLNLQNITINPDMIADHQPHKIQDKLEKYIMGSTEVSENSC